MQQIISNFKQQVARVLRWKVYIYDLRTQNVHTCKSKDVLFCEIVGLKDSSVQRPISGVIGQAN